MKRITIGFFTIVMCTLVLMLTSCQQEGPAQEIASGVKNVTSVENRLAVKSS